MATLEKITPCLWFDANAAEAVNFYVSVFKNSKIGRVTYYTKAVRNKHKMPEGTVMTIEFYIDGREYIALNGGPAFKFNETVSLIIHCATQEEIDFYWDTLSAGGDPAAQQCGWLKDKYGLSWQIIPTALAHMVSDARTDKAERVMKAMQQMKKPDIKALQQSYNAV